MLSVQTVHGLGLVVILANCAHCGVLGEGLTGFDWRLFLVSVRTEGAEGAFKGQGGLSLSSGKFRSAGSPLMTIVDSGQVGKFDGGFSGSQFSRRVHSVLVVVVV